MKKYDAERLVVHTQGRNEEDFIYNSGAWKCGDINFGVGFQDTDSMGLYVVSLWDLWEVVIRATLCIPLSLPHRIRDWWDEVVND